MSTAQARPNGAFRIHGTEGPRPNSSDTPPRADGFRSGFSGVKSRAAALARVQAGLSDRITGAKGVNAIAPHCWSASNRSIGPIGLVLLILVATPLAARADAVPEARAHFVSGRFRECVALLEPLPESARDADVLNMLGGSYAQLGLSDDAQSAFRAAIRRFPDHLAAYQNLGAFLLERNANQEAVEVLTPAVSRFPKSHGLIRTLGVACQRAGRYEEAQAQFRRLPDSDALLGNSYLESGNYPVALAYLNQAARKHPTDAKISYLLGLAYSYLADADRAYAALQRVLELDPRFCLAYHQFTKLKLDASDVADALAYGKQAIQCYPQLAAPHYLISRIHPMLGNAAEFEKEMRLFLTLRLDSHGTKP